MPTLDSTTKSEYGNLGTYKYYPAPAQHPFPAAHLLTHLLVATAWSKQQMPPKTILITGCSKGGIGDGLAREFHARGHTVFATARDPARMAHLRDEHGIATIAMDVTDAASVARAAATVRARLGPGRALDVLVNNAGAFHQMPFADSAVADLRRVLDANITGVFLVTHAFLPLLLPGKDATSRGGAPPRVVANIGSVVEALVPPFQAAYNASKAALYAFSTTLRAELAPFGVRVVHVRTGAVATNLLRDSSALLPPPGSLYAPLREVFARGGLLDGVRFTDVDAYAREVAADLLGERPGAVLWRASLAWLARVLDAVFFVMGTRVRDYFATRQLRAALARAQSTKQKAT